MGREAADRRQRGGCDGPRVPGGPAGGGGGAAGGAALHEGRSASPAAAGGAWRDRRRRSAGAGRPPPAGAVDPRHVDRGTPRGRSGVRHGPAGEAAGGGAHPSDRARAGGSSTTRSFRRNRHRSVCPLRHPPGRGLRRRSRDAPPPVPRQRDRDRRAAHSQGLHPYRTEEAPALIEQARALLRSKPSPPTGRARSATTSPDTTSGSGTSVALRSPRRTPNSPDNVRARAASRPSSTRSTTGYSPTPGPTAPPPAARASIPTRPKRRPGLSSAAARCCVSKRSPPPGRGSSATPSRPTTNG